MMDEEENSENRRSSRRVTSSSKSARKSALEELREARLAGRKHRPNLEVKDVYEVVEEAEYHKIVEGRQNDDFVVDDDGGGYVDTGADFEDDDYYDDGEGAEDKPKKKKKDKKEKKGALDSFFSVTTTKTKGDDQKAKLKLDDDEDLQNMLAELGESGPSDLAAAFETPNFEASPPHSEQPMNPFKRKKIESSPASNEIIGRPLKKIRRETFDRNHGRISTPKPPPPSVDQIKENTPSMVSKPEKEEEEYDDYDYGVPMDDEMDCDFLQETKVAMKESAPEEKEKEVKKEVEAEETVVKDVLRKNAPLTLSEEQWDVDQDQGTDEAPLPEMKIGNEEFYTEKVREDKTVKAIRMYWIDAFEDTHKSNGTVYLFGRVKVAGDRWASCCLIAKNIYRQVFFLPRAKKLSDPNQDVLADEVFYEIKNVFEKHFSTKALKCRTAKRKLIKDTSFGASAGVETDLMEVQYESRHGKLPADLNGETFSQVFNTTTTPMERLLMELKFMGPGWIEFTDFAEMTAKQTYCEYEFTVDMERMERKPAVEYIGSSGNSLIPPVRTLAINVLTTLNDKKESEICMISMLYNRNCNLVHPSADVKQWQRKCLITKPVNGTMPFNFKSVLEQRRLEKIISTAPNEKALLTLFLARIAEFEPDVILSHDLSALITLLVSRLEKLKIANWSRISRLKRILNIGKVGHSKAAQWELTAGRLLLDSRLVF
ncbi:unnamed protein product [Caenorhabditis auriculariae]|uniref:DNA-directed DNA polymerase n=1 Tax=Caenorhabditis auriculariae TaxID=2777116 RepID=A0A8S1HV72_9PELO|nr:unnamed protein product [Caenorhabditis auriculariae]